MYKMNKKYYPEQLQLFPETELDHLKKLRIARILEDELEAPVDITITKNRSVVITSKRRQGRVQVRLHQVFLYADRRVIKAVGELICKGSKPARFLIDSYIRLHQRGIKIGKKKKTLVLISQGKVYDLKSMLKELGETYRVPTRGIRITWSDAKIRRGQQSIRLGSFIRDDKLIRVHPALDDPKVPKYFVEYIVYHELIHSLVKPVSRKGWTDFHPKDYYQWEKKFENYQKAQEFERYFIGKWLR